MIPKKKVQISGHVDFDIPQKIQIIQARRNAVLIAEGKPYLKMEDLYNEALIALIKKEKI